MKNKTLLISVGREKLHITVTTDLGTTNTINTHELHMTDAKTTTNLIYDMYFNEGINELFIDRTGSGLIVIDSLVGKFERAGYKYDYEKGTVQPVGKEKVNSEEFLSNFFLLVMKKLNISVEEIEKCKLNDEKVENEIIITKDDALIYLKKHNSLAAHSDIITRLYFNDANEYVEDFSYFAKDSHMSSKLLSALKNGTTLSSDLENELSNFIIESKLTIAELGHKASPTNNIIVNVNVTASKFDVEEFSKNINAVLKRVNGRMV